MNGLLLDTNVVVWLLLGAREQIPSAIAATLAEPDTSVAVSAVSVWEIAIKRSIGKLEIEDRWLLTLTALGFDAMPMTAAHAGAAEGLPWHHRDPFDRMLVAQALIEQRTLVTADERLAAYDADVLW